MTLLKDVYIHLNDELNIVLGHLSVSDLITTLNSEELFFFLEQPVSYNKR